MRRVGVVAAMALLLLVAMTGGRAAAVDDTMPPRLAARPEPIPTDQLIVRFHDPPGATRAARQIDRLSAAAGQSLLFVRPMSGGGYVYRLPAPMAPDAITAIANDLMALPEVAYAEPDLVMRHTGDVAGQPAFGAADVAPRSIAAAPDDPSFADQWHYRYVPGVEEGANLLGAWDITTGSADIVVAVLDTGILPHADLAGRTVPGYDFVFNPLNANDNDPPNPPGNPPNSRDANPSDPGDWNTANQCDFVARDSSWHGTHVAGTIGAASNNGEGVAGVNWLAKIMPVRVLGRCGGDMGDIADAIRWSAGLAVPGVPNNPNPARVINMSLGGSGVCKPEGMVQQAINEAVAAGTVVVVAAGNMYDIADFYTPASCDGVITVAAGTRFGDKAWYSNYGSAVELTAPGGEVFPFESEGILSTLNAGKQGPGNDSLAFYQGTSMAAPHVAGVAALLLGQAPTLTPVEVSTLLTATARDFPEDIFYCFPGICGAGLLDAHQALLALENGLLPPGLLSPDDEAMLNTAKPLFEWSAVVGATGYGLVVGTDDAFNDVVLDTTTGGTSYIPATLLADGTYFWRVNALDGAEFSVWSVTRSFTIDTTVVTCDAPQRPSLLSPGDGTTYELAEVMFIWDESIDLPPFYELRVSQSADFSSLIIDKMTNGTSYVTTAPLDEGTYYWSVRGRNQTEDCDVPGEWSEVWSFTVDIDEGCPMPGTPLLLAPADGATTTDPTPTLSWAAADNTTAYFVYVDDDADLSSPEIAETTTGTTFTPGPLAPGVYYWGVSGHVAIEGECDLTGELSEIRSLTVAEGVEFVLYLPGVVR